ncbi:MAG: cellulase family glycosylhydrolase [Mageeibacillus sp.]|jgi:aryl-phospho-beta-D-glucosidase BglC (GH1 family)|nr:cellulase family glycosylhydrolase [Mageeibacillus sp.]MCI1264336.1 cellulase family glycosylhydrolase [Saccharofermentans sp.]
MMRRTITKISALALVLVMSVSLIAVNVFAAPSGAGSSNCWGSGGQITISLSGCDGYGTITVVADFSGTVDSASGWGFDSYEVDGGTVTAIVSASGNNSWAFNGSVGIQVTGTGITSASVTSVTGEGESTASVQTTSQTSSSAAAGDDTETTQTEAPAARGVEGDDWLTTDGSKIVDMNGNEVWLTGVNWFGYNTGTNLFDGVWNCNLNESLKGIADHGFNLIRIPMSAELLLQWEAGEYPQANYNQAYNEELNSMNSLEIFDYVLSLCEQYGMKVMIDIHTVKTDASGHNYPLWYRDDITAEDYIESLRWLAERYADNDTVVAYDLKNEPHGKASEEQHAIWNDSDDPDNWKAVAEDAGNAILDENPHALIVVEGIQIYPTDIASNNFTSTNDDDYYNTWWGANLMGVRDYPVDLGSDERNAQIVYSPHDYGPRVYEQPWFEGGFTYDSLYEDAWYDYWLYIEEENIAPVLIGEWGGFMDGDNLTWMTYLRQLIAEKKLSFTFWCYNANSGDTGGLVLDDFKTWDEEKYDFVKTVLWQTDDGRFVGLDHVVPLGANGICLSDYTGDAVAPVPLTDTDGTDTASSDSVPFMSDSAENKSPAVTEDTGSSHMPEGRARALFVYGLLGVVGIAAIAVISVYTAKIIKRRKKE